MEEVVDPVAREHVLKLVDNRGCIEWTYSHPDYPSEGVPWSFDAALNLVTRSDKQNLFIYNPETHSHLEQIEQVLSVWRNKHILITFDTEEQTIVDRIMRLVIDRGIKIEKNGINFRYDRGNYSEGEMISVHNYYNRIGFQTLTEDPEGKMYYQRMLHNIKLLRNRNLLIDVQLESAEPGFEKLFADMGWNYDERMVAWSNETRSPREITKTFEDDNNEYLFRLWSHDAEISFGERVSSDSDYFSDK